MPSRETESRPCAACGRPLEPGRRARARYHRTGGCKLRAWRRVRAGLAEDAVPNGRRGRTPLGALTQAESAANAARSLAEMKEELAAATAALQEVRRLREQYPDHYDRIRREIWPDDDAPGGGTR